MTPTTPQPSAPRPIRTAATLVVLRDGPEGLEVLMLRRAEKANDQNSGASVFPGGMVDAHDRLLHPLCAGLDDATASARLGLPEGGLDFHAAAIRECFEEAGLLLASDAQGRPVELLTLTSGELDAMRAAAERSTDALLALCAQRGWCLAVERVAYFSHWLTPPGMPRRFDTRFFAAAMPAGQEVRPDGRETVEHLWLKPADAVSPARGLKLMNVTRRVLEHLATFACVDDFMAHAHALRRIPLTMPRLADGPAGRRPVNMEEPAYEEIGHLDPDGQGGGRYVLEAGRVTPLSARVVRVVHDSGLNSFLIGGTEGWALINRVPGDAPHEAALRAAAPGPVRWVLPADSGPQALDLGGATLHALGSQRFLLAEEGMLFTDDATTHAPATDQIVEWIVPSRGFMRRPVSAAAD